LTDAPVPDARTTKEVILEWMRSRELLDTWDQQADDLVARLSDHFQRHYELGFRLGQHTDPDPGEPYESEQEAAFHGGNMQAFIAHMQRMEARASLALDGDTYTLGPEIEDPTPLSWHGDDPHTYEPDGTGEKPAPRKKRR
jgi:hypothetical protein